MKKNGFTLVELLAIIAVLTAIMLLVLPKFSSSVNDRKQKEYNKLIKTIENAGKVYHTYNQGKNKVSINELVKEDLLTSGIKSPIDDTLISGCVFFGKDEKGLNTYTYQKYCNNEGEVILKIDLDGGEVDEDVSGGYIPNAIVSLPNPTKQDYSFIKWQLVEGNSTLNGNKVTIGTTTTTIKAIYNSGNSVVTFDAQGGTVDVISKVVEVGKTYGDLPVPIKAGSEFLGWYTDASSGNQIKSTSIVEGNGSRTLYAHWKNVNLTYDIISKNYSCANVKVGTALLNYTGNCQIFNDDNGNWRIKLLTSGTLTVSNKMIIDAFLVGGGGNNTGSGGYTSTTKQFTLSNTKSYSVVIGSAGNATSFEGIGTANAGGSGSNSQGGNNSGKDGVSICGAREGDSGSECIWYKCEAPTAGSSYGNGATCEFGEGTASGCTRGDDFAYSASAGGCRNVCDLDTGASGKGLTGDNSGRGGACYSTGYSGVVVIRNTR